MNRRCEALETICKKFDVAILYAFGSQAKNAKDLLEEKLDKLPFGQSDMDIGAKCLPGIKLSVIEKVNLALALEDLMGCSRVDLVIFDEADPFLTAEVIRGERLYARDEYEADEYDLYVLRRAGDLAPLERERMALILGEET